MIKLIVSDLDGTLLKNGSQQVSDEMIEIIKELKKHNILFAAASGRQYYNLKRQFASVEQDIVFIPCNGAVLIEQGIIVLKKTIEQEIGLQLMEDIQSRDGLEVLVDAVDTSYIQPKDKQFEYHLRHVVKNHITVLEDILTVPEDILKISVCEVKGIENGSAAYFQETYGDKGNCVVSGREWLDFTHITANKGSALKEYMSLKNLKPSEVMAFGDNFNDVEMLSLVEHSYAMDSAKDEIKAVCKNICHRVEDTLQEFLKGLTKR